MSARAANLLGAHALLAVGRMRAAAGRELGTAAALCALRTFADGTSIDGLRRILGLSHSGGVRIAGRLERAGLLVRAADPADARAIRLTLTAAGRAAADAILAARRAALGQLLAGLDSSEQATLERLLDKALRSTARTGMEADHVCRLCEPAVCGHPARCPVTASAAA